jgi:hypothetical protein
MLNQVVYIGQFKHASWDIELKLPTITVKVDRTYKDEKGEYGDDLIEGVLDFSADAAAALLPRLTEGRLLGIKGRLEIVKSNPQYTRMVVMIEKVTLLTGND